jgi:glycine cleavage system H protein
MGISATMVEIIYQPYSLSLSPVGTVFANGDDFGSLEGYKLSSDLISPVSGTILEINSPLINTKGVIISAINDDPYNAGWLVVVQLSDVSELNALMSPQSYSYLVQGEGLQTNGPV